MSTQDPNSPVSAGTAGLAYAVAKSRGDAALPKTDALQNAILNSTGFSSIATDETGVIRIFNAGAERMLGFTALEVVDKMTPADIFDPREVAARAHALSLELTTPLEAGFEALVVKASRGADDIYELTCIRKDGSRLPAMVSVTALRDAQRGIIGYLLIGTENTAHRHGGLADGGVTEVTRLERELQEAKVNLELSRAAERKANLAKSDFLSGMSHDLRAPLNTILGFAQIIDSEDPPPTLLQTASVEQILRAGWQLLELINEIVDLSQLESGTLALSIEPTSLTEVLRECQAIIVPQGRKRGIKATFPEPNVPCFVSADRSRLKQVLLSLLSNAVKYNRPDGTVVVACAPSTTAGAPERIRVSVADTGTGVSPDLLPQLFEASSSPRRDRSAEEGTAIGLAMSKRLVELMGGALGVETTAGAGSVFWFELNAGAALRVETDTADHAIVEVPVRDGAPVRSTLLYVEDNPANLKLIEQIVARSPAIRLLTAGDGLAGVARARASQPDVILMDINLPGISGIDALRILRDDPATARIPVIALSANAMSGDVDKALKAGFFRYLTKPIKIREFTETLEVALEFAALGKGH